MSANDEDLMRQIREERAKFYGAIDNKNQNPSNNKDNEYQNLLEEKHNEPNEQSYKHNQSVTSNASSINGTTLSLGIMSIIIIAGIIMTLIIYK